MSSADMIQEQIERRRKRGREDLKRIVNQGSHPIYSVFEVTSTSGQTYRVRIHDLEELHNTCTCPDYRTNLIGTCKHIEGVLIQMQEKYGDELAELAEERLSVTRIYLHYARDVTVRISQPLPESESLRQLLARYFDAEGILQGPILHTLPALLHEIDNLPPRQHALLQVTDPVRDHLELLRDREAIRKQKEWFVEQVRQGHRSLNVLNTRLYPYQEEGAMHLAFGRRAMLADDMGLGKTVQAIAAAALLRQLRDIRHVLVISPASLKHQWAREVRRFTDLEAQVIEGPPDQRREQYARPAFFNMINYELVLRDEALIQRMQPDVIILDEAQRIKNWRTKTSTAVKRLQSPYAFVLTGTPLENRLDELYSIFQFLEPRVLGPLWDFNERYYELEPKGKSSYKVVGYKNLDELRSRIGPYVLRRVRDEVLHDLPDRVDNNFFVEMTDDQWIAYDEYAATVARLISTARRRPLSPKERNILLGALIKMRIICNALALHIKDLDEKERERTAPKLRELRDILVDEVAENGHKALIFSQWAGMLELTEPMLQKIGLGYEKLTGDVPTHKRGELIERFFDDKACRVFLSTDAGGTGLNLQAASLVINLDLPWNPAVLEQRIARAHRHGQPRGVQVVNLIAQKTIEERILDTLAAKRNVFQGIFGSEEESPAAISFRDTGQELLKTLDEMLGRPDGEVETEVELEPTAVAAEAPAAAPTPTLESFADLLVARFPGRVLLVRQAPQLPGMGNGAARQGVLVVVDQDPAALRAQVESLLNEHWAGSAPALHLMEREGYRALEALLGQTLAVAAPEAEPYRAPALPRQDQQEAQRKRLQTAEKGFTQAGKRQQLAEVVLNGGFPEEAARPLREALGWGLTAFLALVKEREPSAALPAPREVQASLVEAGHLPADLAARLALVRELTAPPEEGEEPAPLSATSAETLITAVGDLIELGQRRLVEQGL
ncbi:MAG TPA: DEAD/DEAH box helicase [Anaerolineae bacterium]